MTDFLSEFQPFKDLPQDILIQIKQSMTWLEYADQEAIWEVGDLAEEVLFIVKGGVIGMNIGQNGQIFITVMWSQGTVIGHSACITGMPRSENMVANGATVVGKIKKDVFLELFTATPSLSKYLMEHLAYDLRSKILSSSAREILSSKGIVAFDLLARHAQYHSLQFDTPAQKHWAALLGITQETLSRALSQLTQQGIIRYARESIEIVDLAALKKIGSF